MSGLTIRSITETPLSGDVNPFDGLATELVGEIASHIGPSRVNFEKACSRFHEFATKLFEAGKRLCAYAIERPFTRQEREERENLLKGIATGRTRALGFSPELAGNELDELRSLPPIDDVSSLEIERKLECEIDEFYKVFKKRANEFHWEILGREYFTGLAKAIPNFASAFFYVDQSNSLFLNYKLETILQKGSKKSYDEVIEKYTIQDIKNITLESFEERVEFIAEFFRPIHKLVIITNMLLSINRKGKSAQEQIQRTAEIEALRQELVNISDDSPRLVAVRESIEAKLQKKKVELNTRRAELCGPTGFDGEIHRAFQAMQEEAAIFKPFIKQQFEFIANHCSALQELSESSDQAFYDFDAELLMGEFLYRAREFSGVLNSIEESRARFLDVRRCHLDLVGELSYIAVFDQTGQIIGGKLFNIEYELHPQVIDRAVHALIDSQAVFYDLLNGDVEESVLQISGRASNLYNVLFHFA